MELAVAKTSPLGQYLAQLDDGDGDSISAQLTETRQVKKRPRRQEKNARVGWKETARRLNRRVQLLLVQRTLSQLSSVCPTIKEELQQAVGGADAALLTETRADVRGWRRHFAVLKMLDRRRVRLENFWRSSAVVAGLAAVIAAVHVPVCVWMGVISLLLLLLLELSARLLFVWHDRRSMRLVASLRAFESALEKFNRTFDDSLELVKRAELASRGYRLGAGLLPPIGRLESAALNTEEGAANTGGTDEAVVKHQLRCLPLRRRLRTVNGRLQAHAATFLKSVDTYATIKTRGNADDDDPGDSQAPSLLLTALTKQHSRSTLLVESAVHSLLVRKLARVCSSREGPNMDSTVFRVLGLHRTAVDQLIWRLTSWSGELETWNVTSDPSALLSSASVPEPLQRQQPEQYVPSDGGDPHLKGIAMQLQELRSTSETLSALVMAAQYELASPELRAETLADSNEAMGSLVRQLQEVWSNYETALRSETAEDSQDAMSTSTEEEAPKSQLTTISAAISSVPDPEDPDCTVVFTGTSTGDEGFDLQALLKQQEVNTAVTSAASKPLFVPELRDVLAYRQAHAQSGKLRQVDYDPALPSVVTSDSPLHPPADVMFALPKVPPRGRPHRAAFVSAPAATARVFKSPAVNVFSTELQALLRSRCPKPPTSG